MSFLTTFVILYFLCVLYVKTENTEARDACAPFDSDEDGCNSHTFTLTGYGDAGCSYVPLTSIAQDPNNPEYVCLPDHCGLFVNNQNRCEEDIYCSWEADPNNLRSTIHRCYPVCFNKLDIMFLVDGSTSRTDSDSDELTPFQENLAAIQDFVENNIPESASTNTAYETREYILSFAGRDDSSDFKFSSTLDFTLSESLEQSEIVDHISNLEGLGSKTNIRRALLEAYYLFEEDTEADRQRAIVIFSDGAPTEQSYVTDHLRDNNDLSYSDHDDNTRISLGLIGCDNVNSDRCEPYQYYDLATLFWDPLNVYYLWVLLGEEIQTNQAGFVSNGPLFASDFVVDDTTDLIQIENDDFQPFLDSVSASSLSRSIDASVCSRITTAPTATTSSPTAAPTTISPPGLDDTDNNAVSNTNSPTQVPTSNPIAISQIFNDLSPLCETHCPSGCSECINCCNGLVDDDNFLSEYSRCLGLAGTC